MAIVLATFENDLQWSQPTSLPASRSSGDRRSSVCNPLLVAEFISQQKVYTFTLLGSHIIPYSFSY